MADSHKHSNKKNYNRKRNFSKFVPVKICTIKKNMSFNESHLLSKTNGGKYQKKKI